MPELQNAHALSIGIADYQHLRKLPEVRDAADVAAELANPEVGGYPPGNVRLLLDGEATRDAIRTELADLAARCDADSTAFIYFSGHGGRIESGPAAGQYLLPVETVYPADEDLARTAISGAEFTDALRVIRSRRVVVVFDCCHSGGIGEVKDIRTRPVKPGLSDGYYAEALGTGQGRVIYASCDPSEVSLVLAGANYGVFTQHLLEGLRGGVESDDGFVRFFDLFEYLQPRVTKDSPRQHPVLKCEIKDNFPVALYRGGRKGAVLRDAEGYRYDAYISYVDRPPDSDWVWDTLVKRLRDEGLRVAVSGDSGDPGVPHLVNADRGIQQSKRILTVLSRAYLADRAAEFEHIRAAMLGMQKGEYRLLPIKFEAVDETNVPGWLGILTPLDLTHPRRAATALDRLVEALRQPVPR